MNSSDREQVLSYVKQGLPVLPADESVWTVKEDTTQFREMQRSHNKIMGSLEEAILRSGLKNGMTISFHHHFRNGDYVLNMVMEKLAEMGFRNLVLAASSLAECHSPLIGHIQNGVISRIETSGIRGELAEAISNGLMDTPVIFRSHGSRAYMVSRRKVKVDVAFLGAPSCDSFGNANGYSTGDDSGTCCGSMGYAKLDAQYARKVIILTDNIVSYPNTPFGIPQSHVDYIVKVDSIGDPTGIMAGATRYTKNPKELLIAETAANVIDASGYLYDGFSMQMGSGGASLATARFLREKMLERQIVARFALGGITGQVTKMHEEGLIQKILDVQSFDMTAALSLKYNHYHSQIDASHYASPSNAGAAVNQLDVAVLSALEADTEFNVNVLTGADGAIRGAIGGHPDAAAGASMTVLVVPLTRGRIPCIVDRVNTVVTPGRSVDVIVTEYGVAVNPDRPELQERFEKARIKLRSIQELKRMAEEITGRPRPIQYTDKVVGIVTYRDGSVIDLIRQVKGRE